MKIKLLLKYVIFLFMILYGTLFIVTFVSPQTIEKQAQIFIKEEVSKQTHERIEDIKSHKIFKSKLMDWAKEKMEKEKEKLLALQMALHEKVDEKLVDVMAEMSNKEAKWRTEKQKFLHTMLEGYTKSIANGIKRIKAFMEESYVKTLQKLLDDFKIFLGSNFLVLSLLLFLLHHKKDNKSILEVLSFLMLISTLIASYFYIFNQNWFFTFIFNDYVGLYYLLYLGIVFGFLVDIVLNKARISDFIANVIGSFFNSLTV